MRYSFGYKMKLFKNIKFDMEMSFFLLLYSVPIIVVECGTILWYASVFAGINLFLKKDSVTPEPINNKSKYILQAIFVILLCFLLRFFLLMGWTDPGLRMNNKQWIPTYSLIFYFILPILWRKRELRNNITKRNIIVTSAVVSIPIIINNIRLYYAGIYVDTDIYNSLFKIWSYIVIAAILEELFFRGFLYEILKRCISDMKAMILSSLVFTLWHFNLLVLLMNSANKELFYNLLCVFILGVLSCYIYSRTRSLVPSIIFHAVNNGLIIELFLVADFLHN